MMHFMKCVQLCTVRGLNGLIFFFQEKDISLSGEHVREGLSCVISVKVPNPEFEGQTKVFQKPDRCFL